MNARYDHMCLTVSDIDRSVAFYEKYFGLKLVRRDQPHTGELVEAMTKVKGGELLAAFLTNGRFVLELIQFTKEKGVHAIAVPANEIGSAHIGFSVDDVREAYRSMSADGLCFNAPPIVSQRRNTWSVMLVDPDGISIELREGPALPADLMASVAA